MKDRPKKQPKKRASFEELIFDAAHPIPRRTPEEASKLLLSDEIHDYDRKLIVNTVSEMYETAKLMKEIRTVPKITVFGSARTKPDDPDYQLCKNFCKQLASLGYMVITGAGPGIMAAGHEGAGPDHSIGVNIDLPFEQSVNEFIAKSKYLITYRYFYTRKLTFVREADAVVLFPGGFGTMDEAFEVLTLLQTGRAMPVPFVLMENEDGTYWETWTEYVKEGLLENNTISPEDMYIFRRLHDIGEAIDYINNFFRRYHSLRYVEDKVVIRLNTPLPESLLKDLNEEYKDFVGDEGIVATDPLPEEADEPDLAHLPRLVMRANRDKPVKMYALIRSLNRDVSSSSTRRQDREEVIKAKKAYEEERRKIAAQKDEDKSKRKNPHRNPRPKREKVRTNSAQ